MVSKINVLVSNTVLIPGTRLANLLVDGLCGNTGFNMFEGEKFIECPQDTRGQNIHLQRSVKNSWMDVAEVEAIVYALK